MTNSVYDLSLELEIESLTLRQLERQRKRMMLKLNPKGFSGGTSYEPLDNIHGSGSMAFSDVLISLNELEVLIRQQVARIGDMELEIKKIYKLIDSFQGLKQKVKYMQLVEGKSLKDIASELNYSYIHIRRIANR